MSFTPFLRRSKDAEHSSTAAATTPPTLRATCAAIRGADIGGGSFRGELGATMTPNDKVPMTLDLNLTGFAGTKQGLTGGISVAWMF